MTIEQKDAKFLAFQLYMKKTPINAIAQACGVTARTIQRWARADFDKIMLKVSVAEDESDEILPMLQRIADSDNEIIDLRITSRLAKRLLALTETAIGAVENTFNNPDARVSDLLKACELVGCWSGLSSGDGVLKKLTKTFELQIVVDADTGDAELTPDKLIESRRLENQQSQEQSFEYTNQVFNNFLDTGELPSEFEKFFDWGFFWSNLQMWDEGEKTEFFNKAKLILRSRTELANEAQ